MAKFYHFLVFRQKLLIFICILQFIQIVDTKENNTVCHVVMLQEVSGKSIFSGVCRVGTKNGVAADTLVDYGNVLCLRICLKTFGKIVSPSRIAVRFLTEIGSVRTVSVETVRYKQTPSRFEEPKPRKNSGSKPPRRKR